MKQLDTMAKVDESRQEQYREIMEGYNPSPFINREWPMKDGMYQQNSAFENDVVCASGTSTSLIML